MVISWPVRSEEPKEGKYVQMQLTLKCFCGSFLSFACGVAAKGRVPTAESMARPSHGSETHNAMVVGHLWRGFFVGKISRIMLRRPFWRSLPSSLPAMKNVFLWKQWVYAI